MSPEAYSWEIRETAEELFIIDGRTYDQVSELTGVSVTQLKRWGVESEPSWTERRREYRNAQTSVRRNVMLAKARLIESVIETEDAQKAYAFSSLVSSGKLLDQEAAERINGSNQQQPDCAVSVENSNLDQLDIIEGLSLAMNNKITAMLTSPGALTATSIRELQQAMALVDKLKAKIAAQSNEDDQGKGTSAATIDQMRAAIMQGLKV